MKTASEHDDLPAMEHSLFRIIVGLLLVAVLFFYAIRYFSSLYDEVSDYQSQMQAQRFADTVQFIRQQWLAKDKQSSFKLDYKQANGPSQKLLFQVNRYGWVVNVASEEQRLDCQHLWDYLSTGSDQQKQGIGANAKKIQVVQKINGCSYFRNNKELIFNYNSFNGKITKLDR